MNIYCYEINLMRLNEASIHERSGRPMLSCDHEQFVTPVAGIITPSITREVIKILTEMVERFQDFQEKNPSLFNVSVIKEETPESKKIEKIFIWAGIDTATKSAIEFIDLFKRPPNVPERLKKMTGFALTRALCL